MSQRKVDRALLAVSWGWYALKLTALVCVVWSIGSKMKF